MLITNIFVLFLNLYAIYSRGECRQNCCLTMFVMSFIILYESLILDMKLYLVIFNTLVILKQLFSRHLNINKYT